MSETNTLVIYKIPKPLISTVTEQLSALEPTDLVRWIQLRFMRRVLAVFNSQAAATAALPQFLAQLKLIKGCEGVAIGFSINNNVGNLRDSHLQLPDPGKLWFVSPPPSPPGEWEDSLEEKPNTRTHYEAEFNDQLFKALAATEEAAGARSGSESLNSPVTPVDSKKPFAPDSPRTVTIIEAHENNPALQVTADDDDGEMTKNC